MTTEKNAKGGSLRAHIHSANQERTTLPGLHPYGVLALAIGLSTAALWPLAAGAQEAPPTEAAESKEEESAKEPRNNDTLVPISVTADRQQRSLMETPANISRIRDDELDKRMDNTVEETFRYEPGIQVPRQTSGTDPFNSAGGVEIRGVGGNRTQILVDGTRTLERITDNTRDVVNTSNMKAVDIVRGPNSVLWGSDALGGVVNFITKDPVDYLAESGGDTAAEGSFSYDSLTDGFTERLAGAQRFKLGDQTLEAMLAYTRRDAHEPELSNARAGADAKQPCPRNPEAIKCDELDPTDISSNNVLSKLVWLPNDSHQIRVTGEFFERETLVDQLSTRGDITNSLGAVTGTELSYNREQDTERWRLALDHEWDIHSPALNTLKWQLSYSPQTITRTGNRHLIDAGTGDHEQVLSSLVYEENFTELDIQLGSSFKLGATTHDLTYGFDGDYATTDYERQDITNNLTAGTTTVERAGGFNFANSETIRADGYIQDEIGLFGGTLKIIPGLRYSTYKITPEPDSDYQLIAGAEPKEIEEDDLQFKLGSIVELGGPYSAYVSYAEGFKMPTAQQLYQSLDSLPFFALVPNPDLKPESVRSYEAGFRGDFQDGFFSVNVFQAEYQDFIQNFVDADPLRYGFAPGTMTLTYDNVDRVEIWGVEAAAGWQIDRNWRVNGALSHQRGTQQNNGGAEENFNGAIPFNMTAGVGYELPGLGLDIELVSTLQQGMTRVTDPSTEFTPSGYAIFDLLTTWEPADYLTLHLAAYNLFDERYFPAASAGHAINGSDALARSNPVELQVGAGRSVKAGVSFRF